MDLSGIGKFYYQKQKYRKTLKIYFYILKNVILVDENMRDNAYAFLEEEIILELCNQLRLGSPWIMIQSAKSIANLGKYSETVALKILDSKFEIVPLLIYLLEKGCLQFRIEVMHVFQDLGSHSSRSAQRIADFGGLEVMVNYIKNPKIRVRLKVAACEAIGSVGGKDISLALQIENLGAFELIQSMFIDSRNVLKIAAISSLGHLCNAGTQVGDILVDGECHIDVMDFVSAENLELKGQALKTLADFSANSENLAKAILEIDGLPTITQNLKHEMSEIQELSMNIIKCMAKNSENIAQRLVALNIIDILLDEIFDKKSNVRKDALATLSIIASHSHILAMKCIEKNVPEHLISLLIFESDDDLLTESAKCLGEIGKHGPKEADHLGILHAFEKLIFHYCNKESSPELKNVCKEALDRNFKYLSNVLVLEKLLIDAPSDLLHHLIDRLYNVLSRHDYLLRLFIYSGGLKNLMSLQIPPGTKLMQDFKRLKNCFSQEMVRAYEMNLPPNWEEQIEQLSEVEIASRIQNLIKKIDNIEKRTAHLEKEGVATSSECTKRTLFKPEKHGKRTCTCCARIPQTKVTLAAENVVVAEDDQSKFETEEEQTVKRSSSVNKKKEKAKSKKKSSPEKVKNK